MEFIPTNKGGSKLCYDNFMYLRQRAFSQKIRWDCSKRRKESCRAILCTDLNLENPVVEGNHTHDGSSFEIEIAKLRASLKEKALQAEGNPKHLIGSVFANLDKEVRAKLGSVASLSRIVRRHQQRGRSKKSSVDKANEKELVSPKLEIASPVKQEQDLELPEESARIANCGTSSHTTPDNQQNSLCPVKLHEVFQEASLFVKEHQDADLATVQGRKRQRSRRNSGKENVQGRKRQRKCAGPETAKEKCKLMKPVATQEERKVMQLMVVQQEKKLAPLLAVQEEQNLIQPVAVREDHEHLQPKALCEHEHERTSPELTCVPAVMKQLREDDSPGMVPELQSPEAQEKESGGTMVVQELSCVSPVQELENTSSEAVGAIQELSCVPVVLERENTSSVPVQQLLHLPAVKDLNGTNSEVAHAFPCAPAIQELDSTISGTFQESAYVAPERAGLEGVQEFPMMQELAYDATGKYPRASQAQQPAFLDYAVSNPYSLTEDLQRRLEVLTGERDSLLHARSKWEEEKLYLTNRIHCLVSEKEAMQQHLEYWRKWKAKKENETDRILSEQMKLHEEKKALENIKESFLQEKTNWEMDIISFQHERDSFQFEKLKWEKERKCILDQMCKPQNNGDSGRN